MSKEGFRPSDLIPSPEERTNNIEIGRRLERLYHAKIRPVPSVWYNSRMDPNVHVAIHECITDGPDGVMRLPPFLEPPVYAFDLTTSGTPVNVTLSTGVQLPSHYIGYLKENRVICYTKKFGLFDLQGNAVSVEELGTVNRDTPLEEALADFGLEVEIPEIEFSLFKYEHVNEVPIDDRERLKILFHLRLIETGQFI